jgi:hypothetical protein
MKFNLRDKIIIRGKTFYICSEITYDLLHRIIYELSELPGGGGEVIELSIDEMIQLTR